MSLFESSEYTAMIVRKHFGGNMKMGALLWGWFVYGLVPAVISFLRTGSSRGVAAGLL